MAQQDQSGDILTMKVNLDINKGNQLEKKIKIPSHKEIQAIM